MLKTDIYYTNKATKPSFIARKLSLSSPLHQECNKIKTHEHSILMVNKATYDNGHILSGHLVPDVRK